MELPTSWEQIILIFGILQGIILSIALANLKGKRSPANNLLIYFILCLTFLLFAAVTAKNEFMKNFKLGYIADTLAFLYGPLLYLYTRKLLITETIKHIWKHFIPASAFFVINLTISFLANNTLESNFITGLFNVLSVLALVHVSSYLIMCFFTIHLYQKKLNQEIAYNLSVRYLYVIISTVGLSVILFLFNTLNVSIGIVSSFKFMNYNLMWSCISLTTFILAYYAIINPQLFRVVHNPTGKQKNLEEDINFIKTDLKKVMERDRLYLDPDLTLGKLALRLALRKELISKVINQGFSLNFYQYVNKYRVDEFKRIAQLENNKHLSYLGLAYESGFKSKTTFYKAFKEITNTTPSNYLRNIKNS